MKHIGTCSLTTLACLAFCTCGFGQRDASDHQPVEIIQGQPAKSPAPTPTTPSPIPGATVQPSTPVAAPSLLDHPAQPATVSLTSGKLTVQANNSSLSDILRQVSKAGGMKIDGLRTGADQRIFGSYGPGAPRDVLSDLLNGSGYNVMMLGVTPSGAPRELTLTARNNSAAPSAPAQAANDNEAQNEDDQDEVQPTQYQDDQQNDPNPPPSPPETPNGVRTPQQMLQELQRLRQEAQRPPQQQPN